jgi:hypothetical protein
MSRETLAKEALVIAKENPQGLGQGEDELAMG